MYDNEYWLKEAQRCFPGWWTEIERTHNQLDYLYPGYSIGQIKEKFGTLRYYAAFPEEDKVKLSIAVDLMSKAGAYSSWHCRVCGIRGKMRSRYNDVLCDQHYQERLDDKGIVEPKCNHIFGNYFEGAETSPEFEYQEFKFCPECGEKL